MYFSVGSGITCTCYLYTSHLHLTSFFLNTIVYVRSAKIGQIPCGKKVKIPASYGVFKNLGGRGFRFFVKNKEHRGTSRTYATTLYEH